MQAEMSIKIFLKSFKKYDAEKVYVFLSAHVLFLFFHTINSNNI